MKKLSIVAVICIIAMLFASCSGSTPAPTEPNDTQKAAVLSIVKAAAGADYSDATELKLNGETTTTDALIPALVTNFLAGTEFTISANVVKDFAAESLDPITSGKIDLSVEATIQGKATFTNPETPDVDITTATVTLKSSNTNLNATIGEEKYELTLDANINNKNVKSAITKLMEVLNSASEIDYAQVIDIVFDALGGENVFDLQLNGTRIQVRPIIDIFNGSQAG